VKVLTDAGGLDCCCDAVNQCPVGCPTCFTVANVGVTQIHWERDDGFGAFCGGTFSIIRVPLGTGCHWERDPNGVSSLCGPFLIPPEVDLDCDADDGWVGQIAFNITGGGILTTRYRTAAFTPCPGGQTYTFFDSSGPPNWTVIDPGVWSV